MNWILAFLPNTRPKSDKRLTELAVIHGYSGTFRWMIENGYNPLTTAGFIWKFQARSEFTI